MQVKEHPESKAEQDNAKSYGVSQHLRVAWLLQMQLSAHGRRFSFACALQGIGSFLCPGKETNFPPMESIGKENYRWNTNGILFKIHDT